MKGLGQKYLWSLGLGAVLVWLAVKDQDFAGFGERLAAAAAPKGKRRACDRPRIAK